MSSKLKACWSAFLRWRKRGMPFRLTILILILISATDLRLFTTNHIPLINELVLLACRAIRYSSEPKVTSAYLRYFHSRENVELQKLLKSRQKTGNIKLLPAEENELKKRPSKANFNVLFAAAKRNQLLPVGLSLRQKKREFLAASLGLTALRFDPDWTDVKHEVMNCWEFTLFGNWKFGLWYIANFLLLLIPLPFTTTIPWFIIGLTAGYAVSMNCTRWQRFAAVLSSVLITFIWTIHYLDFRMHPYYMKYYLATRLSIVIYFMCYAAIAAILGIRLKLWARKKGYDKKLLQILLACSGIILLFPFYFHNYGMYRGRLIFFRFTRDFLCFSNWDYLIVFCPIGAIVLAWAVVLYFRSRKVAVLSKNDEPETDAEGSKGK
jgi:hypothetical protein